MADRTYIYIDGESHYMRSENAWKVIHGSGASLERLRCKGDPCDQMTLVIPKARVFWTRRMNPGAHRMTYFTSVVTNEQDMHDARVSLRSFDLDPHVILERKDQVQRRQNILRDAVLIEKPKGVDIALAVRMLDDSQYQFEVCHLYTSDIDFLPLVQALRARGKKVLIHGYRDGLCKQSAYLHACDQFIDLEQMLREECELAPET